MGLRASGRGKAEGQGAHVDLGLHNFDGLPRPIIIVADEGPRQARWGETSAARGSIIEAGAP